MTEEEFNLRVTKQVNSELSRREAKALKEKTLKKKNRPKKRKSAKNEGLLYF